MGAGSSDLFAVWIANHKESQRVMSGLEISPVKRRNRAQ